MRFLQENIELFASKESRKSKRVFRLLSQKIKSRTIDQVKSHHQKMLLKFKSVEGIIELLLDCKKLRKPRAKAVEVEV